MDLSAAEIRVLGCLLEKQRTTPDQYPLTLNSLRLACNQATNREPVVQYDEDVLREAVRRLGKRGYIRFASGHSSRAAKYRHLLSEALPMSDSETSLMCVLMLRGAQTPGELKQRTDRMHSFEGLGEVNEVLEQLIDRGLVERLDRRPGQKEERYIHLLDRDAEPASEAVSVDDAGAEMGERRVMAPQEPALAERVSRLELEVAELRAALARMQGEHVDRELTPLGSEAERERHDLPNHEPPSTAVDEVIEAEEHWAEEVAQQRP